MSEKKHIDRLFQEKFKDFEVEPAPEMWSQIEARLEEKKDRKIIPFWFQFAGVAAVLLVGLLIALNWSDTKPEQNSVPMVSSPGKENPTNGAIVGSDNDSLKTTQKTNEAITESEAGNSLNSGTSSDQNKNGISNPTNTPPKNAAERANKSISTQDANRGVVASPERKSGKSDGLKNNRKTSGENRTISNQDNDSRYATASGETRKARKNTNVNSNVSGSKGLSDENDSRYATTSGQKISTDKHPNSGVSQQSDANNEADSRYATSSGQKTRSGKNANSKSPAQTDSRYAVTPDKNTGDTSLKSTENIANQNLKEKNNVTKNTIAVNENNQSGTPQQHNNPVTETTTSTQAITAKTDDMKKDSTGIATVEQPNALEELLKNEKEKKSVTDNEPKINRWQVTTNVAPIYLSSTSEGSPIDSRFANNEKDYKTKLSYGVGLSYAVSKRLSVRAGVNSIAFEYDTDDVIFNQSPNARQLEHVQTNVQGSLLNIQAKNDPTVASAAPEIGQNGNITPQFDGSLNQKTGYIEVPVELAYKVIDKRFGVEVIGGFSTLFLNQNEVSVVSSSTEMEIGKANNLNDTHFSTNIGLGVKYDIVKSLQFKLEPMFKYQINTFTDSGNFKPYFFGVYTGLNYRF